MADIARGNTILSYSASCHLHTVLHCSEISISAYYQYVTL